MKLIKLTDGYRCTAYGTRWGLNTPKKILPSHRTPRLCTPGVFHAYTSIEQAMLLWPVHLLGFRGLRIFEAQGDPVVDDGTKCGCYELTLTKELVTPDWYNTERIFDHIVDWVRHKMTRISQNHKNDWSSEAIQIRIKMYFDSQNARMKPNMVAGLLRDYSYHVDSVDFPALVDEVKGELSRRLP